MSNYSILPNRRSIRLKGYDYSQEGLYFVTICVQDRVCLFGKIVTSPVPNFGPPSPQGEGKYMELNEFGKIAQQELLKTNDIRGNIEIDSFVVMPNHVHFIVHIVCDAVRRGELNSPENDNDENDNIQMGEFKLHLPENEDDENDNIQTGEFKLNLPENKNGGIKMVECNALNETGEFNTNIQMGECNKTGEFNSPQQTVGAMVRGYKSAVTKQLYALGFSGKLWQRNYYEHIIRTPESYERIANYIENNPACWDNDKFYLVS